MYQGVSITILDRTLKQVVEEEEGNYVGRRRVLADMLGDPCSFTVTSSGSCGDEDLGTSPRKMVEHAITAAYNQGALPGRANGFKVVRIFGEVKKTGDVQRDDYAIDSVVNTVVIQFCQYFPRRSRRS